MPPSDASPEFRKLRTAAALMTAAVATTPLASQSIRRRVPRQVDQVQAWGQQLRDSKPRRRWLAVQSLATAGRPAVEVLLKALDHTGPDQPRTANLAAEALRRMGAAAAPAVPRLLALLEADSLTQRTRICHILGALIPHAVEHAAAAERKTIRLLASPSGGAIRKEGVPCLVRFQLATNPIATAQLLRDLSGRDATRRVYAAQTLPQRTLTPATRNQAIRALTAACAEVRQPSHTAYSFDHGGHHYERVARTHDQRSVRRQLARALRAFRASVPRQGWVALASAADPEQRQRAALALGALADPAAVPALVRLVADRDLEVRGDAISALGMLGEGAKSSLPALRRCAAGADKGLAARARAALLRIAPDRDG